VTVPLNSRPRPNPLVMRESRGRRNGLVQRRGVSCELTATAVARSDSRRILAARAESGSRPNVGATVSRSTGYSPRVRVSDVRSVSVRPPTEQYTWIPNESPASIGTPARDASASRSDAGAKCSASPATLPDSVAPDGTPETRTRNSAPWRGAGGSHAIVVESPQAFRPLRPSRSAVRWSLHQAAETIGAMNSRVSTRVGMRET
jgi:hypothetical protein